MQIRQDLGIIEEALKERKKEREFRSQNFFH